MLVNETYAYDDVCCLPLANATISAYYDAVCVYLFMVNGTLFAYIHTLCLWNDSLLSSNTYVDDNVCL